MNRQWLKKVQQKSDLLSWVGVVLFSLFIAFLLVQSLDALSLWMDEGFYYLAAQKISEFGYPLFPSGHIYWKAIVYAYVSALFSFIFGFTVFNLRLISVLATLGLIPVVYLTGKRFFGRFVGLASVVVFALSIWVAEYSRTVIYFAPLQLVSLLGVYLFYRGFFEGSKRSKVGATAVFVIAPLIHQLGMGVWFCFPAYFLVRGAKRFFKKDILMSLGVTTLFYAAVQIHEFFFWKVGYVYAKTDLSLRGMWNYFFGGFSLSYFWEFYRSFPLMSLIIFAGIFLLLGAWLLEGTGKKASENAFYIKGVFLSLCLVFPLVFLGFFRTHVQPRYLYQLYPLFVLLFVAGLFKICQVLVELLSIAFSIQKKSYKSVVSGVLCVCLLFVCTEGAGVDAVKKIVKRQYKDPIRTDIINRSGRYEHYDHRGAGEYVRHFLGDDDLVVAIHVVFQYIYAGRVDYWLWSGGPGTWDAWEETPEGWKDFYIGARWINTLSDLQRLLETNSERRVWIIGSPSLFRTDHIKKEIADFIRFDKDKRVFVGKDGMSEVYLWHDKDDRLTGGHHTLEGEWLPVLFGRIAYGEGASKGSALYVDKVKDGRRLAAYETEGAYLPGRYRFSLRMQADAFGSRDQLLGLAVVKDNGSAQEAVHIISGDMLEAQDRYQDFGFTFYHPNEGPVHLKFLFTGKGNVWLDCVDILPVKPEKERPESPEGNVTSEGR
ncbi:MAG: glycosyltransferase family 39 protein [Candidatus Aminicenantes bacterium]|nr:glycosyltransferase family 39 protein [Candidatus Aminicenantes bacterium]